MFGEQLAFPFLVKPCRCESCKDYEDSLTNTNCTPKGFHDV